MSNSLGFRDVEHSYQKSPGIFRIMFIGDSVTEGWGVQFQKSFTQLLTNMLNDMKDGRTHEAIVCAQWGANTQLEFNLFINRCQAFNPDLIIIAYTIDDVEPPMQSKIKQNFINSIKIRKPGGSLLWLYTNSATYRFFYLKKEYFRIMSNWNKWLDRCYSDSRWFKRMCSIMKQFKKMSEENNTRLLVVSIPFFGFPLDNRHPFKKYYLKTHEMLRKHGIEVFDTLPYFDGKDYLTLQVHPGHDSHPNEQGHQILAKAIFDHLKKTGFR